MKNVFGAMRSRGVAVKAAAVAAIASVGTVANAAVPTGISDAITTSTTDVITVIGLAAAAGVGVLIISLSWDTGFNLVKKYVKKGSK